MNNTSNETLLNSVFFDTARRTPKRKLYYITWGDKIFKNTNKDKWTYRSPKTARNALIDCLIRNINLSDSLIVRDNHGWIDYGKTLKCVDIFLTSLENSGIIQYKELIIE